MTESLQNPIKMFIRNMCRCCPSSKIKRYIRNQKTPCKGLDSTAIAGLLIDKSMMHHSMPEVIEEARIALIDIDITLPDFAQQVQVQVNNNDAVEEFIARERRNFKH